MQISARSDRGRNEEVKTLSVQALRDYSATNSTRFTVT